MSHYFTCKFDEKLLSNFVKEVINVPGNMVFDNYSLTVVFDKRSLADSGLADKITEQKSLTFATIDRCGEETSSVKVAIDNINQVARYSYDIDDCDNIAYVFTGKIVED